jgi:hypothetical protein
MTFNPFELELYNHLDKKSQPVFLNSRLIVAPGFYTLSIAQDEYLMFNVVNDLGVTAIGSFIIDKIATVLAVKFTITLKRLDEDVNTIKGYLTVEDFTKKYIDNFPSSSKEFNSVSSAAKWLANNFLPQDTEFPLPRINVDVSEIVKTIQTTLPQPLEWDIL